MTQDMLPADMPERFELTQFLNGRTTAWGIMEDRFGAIRARFTVSMHGYWEGNSFILDEAFSYDAGYTETRRWRVAPHEGGRFSASCDDCVGQASGESSKDTIRMFYRFRLKLSTREVVVSFNDRIYRMSHDTAINRTTISKWGVRLGELSIFFKRESDALNKDDALNAA
jgi:hypothetical protein